jgi:hypothetical protein
MLPSAVSLLGGTLFSLAQYRATNQQLANGEMFSNIQNLHGLGNMAKQSGDMLSGAIASYGNSLMAANRAGGVMPNYFSPLWNRLAEGWNNYGDDLGTMNFNGAQMNATFSAHRSAAQLSLFSNLVGNIFDIYETNR